MYFLLVHLLLRKPQKGSPTTPSTITKTITERMDLLLNKDIQRLVAGYEADIMTKQDNASPNPRSETDEAKKLKSVRETMNLHRADKVRKTQNILLSKGIAGTRVPNVVEQLPLRKGGAQIQAPQATIDKDTFLKRSLGSMTATSLDHVRNEHLTALMFNSNRQVSPAAHQAVVNLFRLLSLIASGPISCC